MQHLAQQLEIQREQTRDRSIRCFDNAQGVITEYEGRHLINFCSNDYLGLANHPDIKQIAQTAIEQWGVGAGASHLISGHRQPHNALETALAEWLGYDRVMLFSNGYMANLALGASLAQKHDALIQDKLNHASLIDAMKLSDAQGIRFIHGHAQSLEQQLIRTQSARHRWVITDGVFSMDGDTAPLTEYAALCKEHNATLVVDDAHGLGVLGTRGKGSVSEARLNSDDVPVLMGTFGKAFGGHGAFIASNHTVIEHLIQFARSYHFTTAPPPMLACAHLAALRLIDSTDANSHQQQLHARIAYFKTQCEQYGIECMSSHSAIQPIMIGDNAHTMRVGEHLFEQGFHVGTIRPPTVPDNTARLRITISCEHTPDMIDGLVNALVHALKNKHL